ncbi:MAG: hypothetical protein QOJ59_2694 [Thermomicrobiales bacterium]|jgi:hypothetical protein|nr:hypothetical protein [Thermomicrobiales bacterium]
MSGMDGDATVSREARSRFADQTDESESASDPTGMFAGEREEDRREERTVRRILEEALPGEPGSWKESGAVPEHGHTDGE